MLRQSNKQLRVKHQQVSSDKLYYVKLIAYWVIFIYKNQYFIYNTKNTNKLTLNEIDRAIYELALKYIDKKLTIELFQDTTFTITDLSSYGAISFSPLINKNNSAILGISKIDSKLKRIILSLAFDHRVTEGKIATIFLQELKERIESYKLNNTEIIEKISCYKCFKTLNEDLNDIGFIKVINKKNTESYICDSCLLKF